MAKSSSGPDPEKAEGVVPVPAPSAKSDRVVRIEGIVSRIESLPQPDAQTVLEDESANLAAFLREKHGDSALDAKIKALLK